MNTETSQRAQLNKYMSGIPARRITKFNCKSCGEEIETLKPEIGGDNFSSSCSCPDCGHLMFKNVHSSGLVIVMGMP